MIFKETHGSEPRLRFHSGGGNPSKLRILQAPSQGSAATSKPFQSGISTCGAVVCNLRVRQGGIEYVETTDEQTFHPDHHSDGRYFRKCCPEPGNGESAGRQSD